MTRDGLEKAQNAAGKGVEEVPKLTGGRQDDRSESLQVVPAIEFWTGDLEACGLNGLETIGNVGPVVE